MFPFAFFNRSSRSSGSLWIKENASAFDSLIPSRSEALAALTTLGFPRTASEKAIDAILSSNREKEIGVEELIKLALKNIR